MESNGSKLWRFNKEEKQEEVVESGDKKKALPVRIALGLLSENIDPNDERSLVQMGRGDPSPFQCFRTAAAAEDAVVATLRSAAFNCYAKIYGQPPARNASGSVRDSGEPSTPPENEDYGGDGVDYSGIFMHNEYFADVQPAIDWAKTVAKAAGFLLVTVSHRKQRDGRKDRIMKCDRWRPAEQRNFSAAQWLNTKRKCCGCLFRVLVHQVQNTDMWEIVGAARYGKHNHELIVYPQGHRQLSGLSPAAKQVVIEMSDAQVKPAKILAAVSEKFPEHHPN